MKTVLVTMMSLLFSGIALAKVEGSLNLSSDLDYVKGRKQKRAAAGHYRSTLKISSKKLTMRFKDSLGDRHKVVMSIPRGSFPSEGSFQYDAIVIGQPFSITGTVGKRRERSESRTRLESCTTQRPVRHCWVDRNGRRRCEVRYVNVQGDRYVTYHVVTVHSFVDLLINSAPARFQGQDSTSGIVYERRSTCRPRH